MASHALCLTADSALRKVLRRCFQAVGMGAEFVDRCEDVQAQDLRAVVVAVADGLENGRALARVDTSPGRRPAVLLVGVPLESAETLALFREERFDHVVEVKESLDEGELVVTLAKLLGGDIMGMSKYLTHGAPVHERQVASYDEKRVVIREVVEFAAGLGCRRQVLARLETVTDELLMNALYDAPASRYGCRPLFQGRGRPGAGPVADRAASLAFGCDGRRLAICVRDTFGELRKANLIDNLERAMVERRGPRTDDAEGCGGGLGFYFVLNAASRLVVDVQPGEVTEVICLFDLRKGARDAQMQTRGLSFFAAPSSGSRPPEQVGADGNG